MRATKAKDYPAEYRVWSHMKTRCLNPKADKYQYYGGRGITICTRWLSSFAMFLEDMGPRPSPDHSIERIENNGNYEPGNCRWATRAEQVRNRRNNVLITHKGETQCVAGWAETVGLSDGVIRYRIQQGWTAEQLLTTPSRPKRYEAAGLVLTLDEWCKRTGLARACIRKRLALGWRFSDAIRVPSRTGQKWQHQNS